MTTQQERDWGRGISREIVEELGVLDDPLLSRWVNAVGQKMVPHVARPDVAYTFTVIDSEEVNAFSVPGGYVFVDAGLLNFVHSDDELAAVLGHEMGHVERRHVVTLSQTVKALEVILQVAGIFVPGVGRFGNLAGNLIVTKISRVDELQADQYGLGLMSQAGYDPEAMVAFLDRLESLHPTHKSLLGRYFATHPALGDRVKHLKGYTPLDQPAPAALLAQAIHDSESGEYYVARKKLDRVLQAEPDNALAQSYKQKVAAIFAAPAAPPPRTGLLRSRAAAAVTDAHADGDAVKGRLELAKKELDEYEKYLDYLGYYIDAESRIGIARGTRLDRILSGQVRISRYLDHTYDETSQTIAEAGDLAEGDAKLAKELRALIDKPDPAAPIDAPRMAILIDRSQRAHRMLVQAVDAARGAMAAGWQQGKIVKKFLDAFDEVTDYKGGDMKPAAYAKLRAPLHAALMAAKKAAQAADATARLLNDAQSLETMDRIDMAAPDATPARHASYAAMLARRFGVKQSEVAQAAAYTPMPSDVAAAAVMSTELNVPLTDIARGLAASGQTAPDYADSAGLRAETLQLELGLVWLSYAEGMLP